MLITNLQASIFLYRCLHACQKILREHLLGLSTLRCHSLRRSLCFWGHFSPGFPLLSRGQTQKQLHWRQSRYYPPLQWILGGVADSLRWEISLHVFTVFREGQRGKRRQGSKIMISVMGFAFLVNSLINRNIYRTLSRACHAQVSLILAQHS